jgi:hypothetical protein
LAVRFTTTVLFRISLPRDIQMIPALRDIAERVAQCSGYAAPEAVRIASCVSRAADAVFGRLSVAPNDQIEVVFERESKHLDVWLRYPVPGQGRVPAAVDAALSSEVLRQGMDSVEFGDENGLAYCRLRRVLPHEKVDHECEMPPPEAH